MRTLPLSFLLAAAGLGLEVVYWHLATLGDLRHHAVDFLRDTGIASILFLGVVWVVRTRAQDLAAVSRRTVWLIVLGGVLFRLTLLGTTPRLSDDV